MSLKQQRPQRLRKRQLKRVFALLQILSRVYHLVQFVKLANFLELNSKGVYESLGKEKEGRSGRLVRRPPQKREIWQFHVAVVQRRQSNVQKNVKYVQRFCVADLNLLLFCRSR